MKKENPSISFVRKLLRLQNWRKPKPADAAKMLPKMEFMRFIKTLIKRELIENKTYKHSLRRCSTKLL